MAKRAKGATRRKHVPQRTCVGCRQAESKREMLRVVRTPDGRVELDSSGKRPGRGAYVHRQRDCWQAALQDKHLDHALKTSLSDQDRAALADFAQTLDE
ncbi:MAG: YlxR family protein [Thermoflexales bacterium]|nr:YlxR family protein [Thermoflexales bacterium]